VERVGAGSAAPACARSRAIRDTGNTYEADLLVVRPGATTQHIDATFRVEAGKITAINIAPR
jgi:hypothetical protein